jgi:septal ring factor EnvC (AmiA/AmiB activator)
VVFATRAGAQIIAPRRGQIVFAGPFRGYGQIVIIDHGSGWTSLVTNMSRLTVRVGQNVGDGAPIGRAGPGSPRVIVELRRAGQPVDITRLVS